MLVPASPEHQSLNRQLRHAANDILDGFFIVLFSNFSQLALTPGKNKPYQCKHLPDTHFLERWLVLTKDMFSQY